MHFSFCKVSHGRILVELATTHTILPSRRVTNLLVFQFKIAAHIPFRKYDDSPLVLHELLEQRIDRCMRYAKIPALDDHVDVREHLLHPIQAFAVVPQEVAARDVLGHRERRSGNEAIGQLREQRERRPHRDEGF